MYVNGSKNHLDSENCYVVSKIDKGIFQEHYHHGIRALVVYWWILEAYDLFATFHNFA